MADTCPHKVGDRVVDFRGEKHGTVLQVHAPSHGGASWKVTVRLDVRLGTSKNWTDTVTHYASVWQAE